MEAKQGKVVRLYPAPSKVEADIPSMPTGMPISDLLARRILASQLEQVAGKPASGGIAFLLLVVVISFAAVILWT